MNYYDPARPRQSNGLPQYVDAQGQPIAAIPHINITPREDGKFDAHVHLLRSPNSASPFDTVIYDLVVFFQCLLQDPESVFTHGFGWEFSRGQPVSRSSTLDLADIGL